MVIARRRRTLTRREREILHRVRLALREFWEDETRGDEQLISTDALDRITLNALRKAGDRLAELKDLTPHPSSGYRSGAELRRDVLKLRAAGLV